MQWVSQSIQVDPSLPVEHSAQTGAFLADGSVLSGCWAAVIHMTKTDQRHWSNDAHA